MRSRSRMVGGALLASLLVTVACGDDDPGSSSATTAGGSSETTAPADGSTPTAPPGDEDDPLAPRPLPERTTLTFALSGNFEFVFPVHLANEMGEFERENLEVEVITLPAPDQLPALANGTADIIGIGTSAAALNAMAGGIPMAFFLNTHDSPSDPTTEGIWVRRELLTDDDELDPEQARGMSIVLGTQGFASPTVYVANEMVEAVGLTIDDVEITVLDPNADSLIALQNGAVDAAHLLTPFSDDAGLEECCVLVEPTISSGRYAALVSELESRTDEFAAFTRALIRTNRDHLQGNYHDDDEIAPILSAYTGAPIENVQAAGGYYVFGDVARNDTEIVETLQDMWLDFGEILSYDEPIPAETFANQTVVDAVNGAG